MNHLLEFIFYGVAFVGLFLIIFAVERIMYNLWEGSRRIAPTPRRK